MDHLMVVVQGVVGLLILTQPGMALTAVLNHGRTPAWPLAFVLSVSWLFSSLMLAALQWLSLSLLGPTASRPIAWTLVLVAAVYAWRRGWRVLTECFGRTGIWERCSVAVLAVVTTFWIVLMPLSPYPSQISLGLGDPPAYYHLAANLVAGKGWVVDYFVGDYLGGTLSYVSAQPILVLITTLFFQLFGVNWYSLNVYDAIAAGLLIYLMVSVMLLTTSSTVAHGERALLATLGLCLLPSHFLLFGLGVVTAPGSLACLIVTGLLLLKRESSALGRLVGVACVLFLAWVRPESLLLAGLLVAFYVVSRAWAALDPRPYLRSALLAGCGIAVVVLWLSLPAVVDAYPPAWKGLGLFYLRLEPASGRFIPMYQPWWELNRRLGRVAFEEDGAQAKVANPAIGSELRSHPISFVRYLGESASNAALLLVGALSYPEIALPVDAGGPALVLVGTLLAFAALDTRVRLPVAAVAASMPLLWVLTLGPGLRHLLTISPVILGLALRSVLQRTKWSACTCGMSSGARRWVVPAVGVAAVLLFALESSNLAALRSSAQNRAYAGILNDIASFTSPDDVVASSYPQLVAMATGRRSLGTTWLIENLEPIISKNQPDFILVDDARDGPANYTLLGEGSGWSIPGYVPVVHNPADKYILFRSLGQRVQ